MSILSWLFMSYRGTQLQYSNAAQRHAVKQAKENVCLIHILLALAEGRMFWSYPALPLKRKCSSAVLFRERLFRT